MASPLRELFSTLPNRSEYVFPKFDGEPYRHWHVFKAFKKVLKAKGIDTARFTFKSLRHTTGTLMHLTGADPMAIKDQLRHTDLKTTTNYYIGSDIEYQRAQVEKLALERPEAEA